MNRIQQIQEFLEDFKTKNHSYKTSVLEFMNSTKRNFKKNTSRCPTIHFQRNI